MIISYSKQQPKTEYITTNKGIIHATNEGLMFKSTFQKYYTPATQDVVYPDKIGHNTHRRVRK